MGGVGEDKYGITKGLLLRTTSNVKSVSNNYRGSGYLDLFPNTFWNVKLNNAMNSNYITTYDFKYVCKIR